MEKLKVLIADDQRVHRKQVIEWFVNQPLKTYFKPYIECKYIKQNVTGELNFDTIIDALDHLHIAFVDMYWYEEGFKNGWDGGFYIIDKLESKFPYCLIIPITQFRFSLEVHPEVTTPSKKRYDALPKDGDDLDKSMRFFSYLEKWQLKRIMQMNNTSYWCKILLAIEKNDFSEKILIEENECVLSDFIFPEITLENDTFFGRDKLITEIKKLISYPKNKLWGSENSWGKHTETYFKFIELDEKEGFNKLVKIESRAKDYINSFVDILIAKINNQTTNTFSNKAKNQQLRSHQCKESDIPLIANISKISDIPDDYFDNLLIRYIVLTICHVADKANKPNLNNTFDIYELFDHVTPTDENVKMFYYYLGFNTNRKKSIKYSSYTEDILYKEKEFLLNFNFQYILDKITLNN
jgi:hypothetical protein